MTSRFNQTNSKTFLRKHIFKQQLIWHPDKFAQKVADRLHEQDKEKILETVHHISQALNKALENAELC